MVKMALLSILLETLRRLDYGIWDVLSELAMFTVPLWIAVVAGVLVGWAWKPK